MLDAGHELEHFWNWGTAAFDTLKDAVKQRARTGVGRLGRQHVPEVLPHSSPDGEIESLNHREEGWACCINIRFAQPTGHGPRRPIFEDCHLLSRIEWQKYLENLPQIC
jgi:hypothetical protein